MLCEKPRPAPTGAVRQTRRPCLVPRRRTRRARSSEEGSRHRCAGGTAARLDGRAPERLDHRQKVGLRSSFGLDRLVRDDNPHARRGRSRRQTPSVCQRSSRPPSSGFGDKALRLALAAHIVDRNAEAGPQVRVHLDEQLQTGSGGGNRRPRAAQRRELGTLDVDFDHAAASVDVRRRTDRSRWP